MIERRKNPAVLIALLLAVLMLATISLIVPSVRAQIGFSGPTNVTPALGVQDGGQNVVTFPNAQLVYDALTLGMNTTSNLPAGAGTGTVTFPPTPINAAQVHYATLGFNCDQIVDVSVIAYDANGTTVRGTYRLFSAVPIGNQQVFIGTELTPNATAGTADKTIRWPERAVQFKITNTTATLATCSAYFLAGY